MVQICVCLCFGWDNNVSMFRLKPWNESGFIEMWYSMKITLLNLTKRVPNKLFSATLDIFYFILYLRQYHLFSSETTTVTSVKWDKSCPKSKWKTYLAFCLTYHKLFKRFFCHLRRWFSKELHKSHFQKKALLW